MDKKKVKLLAIAFIVIILIIAAVIVFIVMRRPDLEEIKDSVVKIEIYDEDNQLLGTGSGFCAYESNYIITNYHVIEGARYIKIIDDDNKKYDINKIVIFNSDRDLAVISGNFKFKPIPISNKNIKAGQEITTIGSPKGQLNTVSTGVVSNADDDYEIRITAPISPGSSGGVLLDDEYKVLGVTYAGFNAIDAQNINYAINVKYIKEMKEWLDDDNTFELKAKDVDPIKVDLKFPLNNRGINEKYNIYRKVESIEAFYKYTSFVNGFKATLKETDEKWYKVFEMYTPEEEYECAYIFKNFDKIEEINKERLKNKNVSGFISDQIKYYSLDKIAYGFIIEEYQYVILLEKLNNCTESKEAITFIDSLPIERQQKLILKYCLIYKDINYLTTNEKEEVFNWLKKRYKENDNQNDDDYYIEIAKRFGYKYTQNGNSYTFYWE